MTNPERKRRGCSPWTITGCGCGLLGILGIMLVFFALGVQTMRERRDPTWSRKDYATCQQRLQYLRSALASYHTDHGQYPETLEELNPRYLDTPDRLHCPLHEAGHGAPYQYTPHAPDTPDAVIIRCANHGQGGLALLRDGRIRFEVNDDADSTVSDAPAQ